MIGRWEEILKLNPRSQAFWSFEQCCFSALLCSQVSSGRCTEAMRNWTLTWRHSKRCLEEKTNLVFDPFLEMDMPMTSKGDNRKLHSKSGKATRTYNCTFAFVLGVFNFKWVAFQENGRVSFVLWAGLNSKDHCIKISFLECVKHSDFHPLNQKPRFERFWEKRFDFDAGQPLFREAVLGEKIAQVGNRAEGRPYQILHQRQRLGLGQSFLLLDLGLFCHPGHGFNGKEGYFMFKFICVAGRVLGLFFTFLRSYYALSCWKRHARRRKAYDNHASSWIRGDFSWYIKLSHTAPPLTNWTNWPRALKISKLFCQPAALP